VIQHNTIANNDSTATGSQAFLVGQPNLSVAQPAGVVSRVYSADMNLLMDQFVTDKDKPNVFYPDPLLEANIVFQNRSFYWLNSTPDAQQGDVTVTGIYPAYCDPNTIDPNNPVTCDVSLVEDYTWDLQVMAGVITADPTYVLSPAFSLLTANVGNPGEGDPTTTNVYVVTDPGTDLLNPVDAVFANSYFNVPKQNLLQNEFKTLQTAGAFDEGGNFIQVAYDPLTLLDLVDGSDGVGGAVVYYDFHLAATGSPAVTVGQDVVEPALDIDNQIRSAPTDAGADEL
jgi:hypothetical protein